MVSKGELLQLAHTRLEQAAKLLKAAGEELLAQEADALAERVSATNPSAGPAASRAALLTRRGPSLGSKGPIPKRPRP